MLETIQPFLLSFMIGLLIGIERERSHAEGSKAIGMRTFILLSILGTLAAQIHAPYITLMLSLFVFSALLFGYFRFTEIRKKTNEIGITTEMAGAAVYLLGYLIWKEKLLALSIATVILLILYGRQSLHRFAKEKITAKEIEASITIIIISLVIVSFLPDKVIDPWGLFNPQNFGIIVLILAALQFGGYVAIRLFGEGLGMLLLGFFGGLASSTAVFASLAHANAKKSRKQSTTSAIVAGIFATIATLCGFLIVIFYTAPSLLKIIIWPILATIVFGMAASWLCLRYNQQQKITVTPPNPLDIKAIFKLAFLIGGILLLVGLINQHIGESALPLTSFITGLFEIHGMAYAVALLYQDKGLSLTTATQLLGIMIVASFISKFILIWVIAHNRFAVIMSLFLAGMLGVATAVYFGVFFFHFFN
ncbi:MgtC/SapB family protein [Legionella septentrionalis]|uniref:MgtC/SapB family protein n=1 Tax=Legionella septentrionalis TaxID=2498109 RepID=A0A433JJF0_9GAMM|nr:MgtC/SapB family protein [Legionella septentrionalis]RUQ88025.1 MgtC/SapB family protein [Legionella septentrionalis]RUR02404.1 MgtC/SapB family protein [Legionella septentrionalis]RUR17062.1 MgtC/SapB family protein [Legionella septentrionalis]